MAAIDHPHSVAIVEDSPTQEFFTAPRSERAREFLARIIH
jgi:glutamate/aspartate transport system ATP-binding protein